MAIIVITKGNQSLRRLVISTWPCRIGRDPTCQVILDDDRSSRFHAKIKKRDRMYIIEDLESKNGTYLNGDKVTNSTLKSGDKIIIGDCELVFLTPDTQFDISNEYEEFDHVISSELGLDHPIEIGGSKGVRAQQLRVLGGLDDSLVEQAHDTARLVLEHHSNLLSATSLEESCDILLKGIQTFIPKISRSVVLRWAQNSQRLIPVAMRVVGKKKPFSLSKKAFEECIARKSALVIQPDVKGVTQSSNHRVVLPVVNQGDVVFIIHCEVDEIMHAPKTIEVDAARLLILKSSALLENFLLRRDLDAYMVGIIESMVATLEAKDTYTHGHSERVSRYSMAIADQMQLPKDVKKLLLMSSLCHDVGKIGIPDAILRKASLLNQDEYEEIKQHPVIGANIVGHLPNARKILSGVKYHHEKWDGSGYPDGLAGEDIPFFGRIVAVADVFDAMISGRSYSGFIDASDAIEKLTSEKDLFDPDVLSAMGKAFNEGILTQRTSTRQNFVQNESQTDQKNKKTKGR